MAGYQKEPKNLLGHNGHPTKERSMVNKPIVRTVLDLPVSVICTICAADVEVSGDKFSSDGGSFYCATGRHDFSMSPEKALEATRRHCELLTQIGKSN
jgi:hypothetical protein